MAEVAVSGLAELQKALDELPVKLEAAYMRGALRAGMRVVADAAKANVPANTGNLRNSIRVGSGLDKRTGQVTAYVKAGKAKTKDDPYYAYWVEFGTQAHVIHAKNGKALAFGNFFGSTVHHPGAKPKPYMRPAYDANAQAAVEAAAEYLRGRLDQIQTFDPTQPLPGS